MQAVLLPFYANMELEAYSKHDRRTILQHVTEYLLGCRKFNAVKKALTDFECQTPFQQTLKDLHPEYQKLYRSALRKYVQGKKVTIHEFDRYHLNSLDFDDLSVKRKAYPTEVAVMRSMSPTIKSRVFRLRTNRKIQRMTSCGIDDISQTIYLRVLGAYRVYLPSVGRCLPEKAFYKILHQSIASSIIDKIREMDSSKAQLTVPYALLGEDFEASVDTSFYGTGRFHSSPEEALQAKEYLYDKVPHAERLELLSLFDRT